jgi:hypothetical protein
MAQDLAALAPTAIVAVAFVAGVWLLLRRELAPRRRGGTDTSSGDGAPPAGSQRKSLYFAAWRIMIRRSDRYARCERCLQPMWCVCPRHP